MKALPLLSLLLIIGACRDAPLPEPGAEGPVQIHLWQADDPRPTRLIAAGLRSSDGSLDRFRLAEVVIHRPTPRGIVCCRAPGGLLVLEPATTLRIDPPIRLSGLLEGQPLLGRSAQLLVDDQNGSVTLEEFEAALGLQDIHAEELRLLGRHGMQQGPHRSTPVAAAMAATLGALPHAADISSSTSSSSTAP